MLKLRHEYAVPIDVQRVMKIKQSKVVFDYYDPVELLVRLLVCSPLSAREENLCFFPEAGEELYDFCHGERLQRIHDSVPRGTGVLTAVLFFDEINRDQKVSILVMGLLSWGDFSGNSCGSRHMRKLRWRPSLKSRFHRFVTNICAM